MMKRMMAAVLLLVLCGSVVQAADDLEKGFAQPPDSAKPHTWWHWVNGCITKEGITADLESMKRIGLGGAQLFAVHLNMNAPDGSKIKGPVMFMSPEWRELVRYAVTECKRLDLELSILNCEGWGQAGGPSVTPAQSMQKVVWTESRIIGGQKISLALLQPQSQENYYEDIAVLAFPTAPGDDVSVAPVVTSSDKNAAPIHFTASGSPTVILPLPMPDAPQWVRLEFDREYTFNSIQILIKNMRDTGDPKQWEGSALLDDAARKVLSTLPPPRRWELQVSTDGETFRPVAPIFTHGTTSLPEISGRIFRIWMPVPPPLAEKLPLERTEKIEITGIDLTGVRIDRPEVRTGKTINASAREFSLTTGPIAGITPLDKVITLTGKTEWESPPGKWTLLRIGHTSTGARIAPAVVGGLECDKLNPAAVSDHLTKGMLGTVLHDLEPFVGNTLKNVLCDSWEAGYENWTPRMRKEFRQRRGYMIDPWLPVLTGHVVESIDASERFLWDFRRTIADLVSQNYYGTLRDFTHHHNMGVSAEAVGHGLPAVVDQLQCKGQVDIPMGEFWVGRRDVHDTKEAASAAHIYGKGIVGAEAFTATPEFAAWTRDPASLKSEGDLQFCMGINRFCFHRFVHQPWLDRAPGLTLGPYGSNFERSNTWWEQAKAWIDYISRSQFLLQQGDFVADICYYYGEDAPVGFRFDDLSPKPPAGYDFDVCNTEILKQLKVSHGRIVLPSGMSYRVLVLPARDRMTPGVLCAIRDLVKAGATVVGPKPTQSPSLADFPESDRTVAAIAKELWGDCDGKIVTSHTYGDGRMQWGGSLAEAIGEPPDFSSDDPTLKFIHRRDGKTEIYFVSNQAKREVLAQCTFRVNGLVPELWHPDTGLRETVALYASNDGRITLPIHFDPAGSVFVVFRLPASPDPVVSVQFEDKNLFISSESYLKPGVAGSPVREGAKILLTVSRSGPYTFRTAKGRTLTASAGEIPQPLALSGPWLVRFPPNLGAPGSATFEQLQSWTRAEDAGVKYFSGTATYQKDFTVPESWLRSGLKYYLDLGAVLNIAAVTLNGQDLGVLWKAPFRVEVTSALRANANRLVIKVTNLWPNRLIGDRQDFEKKPVTWTSYNPYRADSELLDSGLLGPVRLSASEVLTLR